MKNCMVWGATGGIGNALVKTLVDGGWQVIALSREELVTELPEIAWIEVDICDEYSIQQAVLAASQEVDEVDLWIYAIGDITSQKIDEMSSDDWQRIADANLNGAVHALQNSMPLLSREAHIVFLGAITERLQLPGLSAYVSAKSGLESFAEVLRKEQRKKQISIIRPGAVATNFWKKVPFRMPANALSPENVAERIIEAYQNGHSGTLDL